MNLEKMQEEIKNNIQSKVKTQKITIEMKDGSVGEFEAEVPPTQEEFDQAIKDSPEIRKFLSSILGVDDILDEDGNFIIGL